MLKIPYLVIFRLELEKTIVILNFSVFNLPKCYISCKKFFLKCKTKIVLFGYFWAGILKNNVEFEISILKYVNMQSFIQKQTNLKRGTKNTLLRYFWAAI